MREELVAAITAHYLNRHREVLETIISHPSCDLLVSGEGTTGCL